MTGQFVKKISPNAYEKQSKVATQRALIGLKNITGDKPKPVISNNDFDMVSQSDIHKLNKDAIINEYTKLLQKCSDINHKNTMYEEEIKKMTGEINTLTEQDEYNQTELENFIDELDTIDNNFKDKEKEIKEITKIKDDTIDKYNNLYTSIIVFNIMSIIYSFLFRYYGINCVISYHVSSIYYIFSYLFYIIFQFFIIISDAIQIFKTFS